MKRSHIYWKNINLGTIVLIIICILFMLAEIVNHRFWLSDFEVYYKAANRIIYSQNLYRIILDGHYIFKYSPTFAIYFIPFIIFPFAIAKFVYWIFLMAIIAVGFNICIKVLNPSLFTLEKKSVNKIILLVTLIFAIHFLRELHLGQVNYLLLFLYILALYFFTKQKMVLFSLMLALSIFIKPFTLIFLPFLLLKKKYLELSMFLGFCFLLFLLPFLFYGSIETTLSQYHLWFNELTIELSHKQGLLDNANHTMFSVFARYTPVRFILINSTVSFIYQLVMLSGIGFLFLWFTRINIKDISLEQKKYYWIIEYSLLVSLIPLLSFTSENAFIFPLILAFIILLHYKDLRRFEKWLSILAFLFIGGNFSELIGKSLSKIIDDISLISIGTLILIYLLYTLRLRNVLKGNCK